MPAYSGAIRRGFSNLPLPPEFKKDVYHPAFRDRNYAIRVIERETGRRLTIPEVMTLFGCNETVARQSRDPRWEAEMERIGW
jgi:hypothetical protein